MRKVVSLLKMELVVREALNPPVKKQTAQSCDMTEQSASLLEGGLGSDFNVCLEDFVRMRVERRQRGFSYLK